MVRHLLPALLLQRDSRTSASPDVVRWLPGQQACQGFPSALWARTQCLLNAEILKGVED